ncbi:MAG: DNA-directed DNA polymerase [Candidatus Diapherotrites archaeon]|nr:DNA-directed DNA polymerase [Candidatus Diapherotrites archaeon]
MNTVVKGIFFNADYQQEGQNSVIRIFVKNHQTSYAFRDPKFKPYFYIIVDQPEKRKKEIMEKKFAEFKIQDIQIVQKKLSPEQNEIPVLKLIFNSTAELKSARDAVMQFEFVRERREYDMPFAKRYRVDSGLIPLNEVTVKYDSETMELLEIKQEEPAKLDLRIGCFDLETHSPDRFSNPELDPILMASYVDEEKEIIWAEKKVNRDYAVLVKNEKELLEKLIETIREQKLDVIGTYNGDSFDLPYIKTRGEKLKVNVGIGCENSQPNIKRRGQENVVEINGLEHVDVYELTKILARFGVVNLIKYDLESVNEALFGEKKEKVKATEINQIWETGKNLERLADYNLEDSRATYRIAKEYLLTWIELGKIVRMPLFEVTRASAGILVEQLLINKSFEQNILLPNLPEEGTIGQRMLQSYEGGFVKEPEHGLHENMVVLDFSSLHPTIMISHNISADTLDCKHKECEEKNKAPTNHYFCTQRKGMLSSILEELFNKRIELKRKLKDLKKDSLEYNKLYARQYSQKILLNSFYGTLGYARFRWYSYECARAVTAYSQQYVKWVAEQAEIEGYKSLYGDTDSVFLKIPETKTQEDVRKFVEQINEKLPGNMNLEIENFYKRGIFVGKKGTEEAAKKKYALMDHKGNLKIVGFEYVRRDWSNIAKRTQKEVLEAVLKEGDTQKAIQIVKKAIQELKDGKVLKEDLKIYTQIKRPLKSYESIGPHVAAAKKAQAKGVRIEVGSVLEYIITRNGKSISDRAELSEFVKEGNYDSDYYIQNQVLPAVIKIINELGYTEEDLIHGGKQKTLSHFFG